jgi:hypothetical protein
MDHVVELQLVKAALNRTNETYSREDLGSLIDFFNSDLNLKLLQTTANREKGQAVSRMIEGQPLTRADLQWIQHVKTHWFSLRGNLRNFTQFKIAMNTILGTP